MLQKIHDRELTVKNGDRLSGAIVLTLGLYVGYESLKLKFGSLTRPGPGFYPTVLALLLVAVSAALVFRSLRFDQRPLQVSFGGRTSYIAITAFAIIVYAAILEAIGFLPCTFVLVLMLMVGIGKVAWLRALLLTGAGTIAAYVIFTQLGIPLPKGILPF